MSAKSVKVDLLARVEGEGGFQVKIRDQQVQTAAIKIFEPPRFFEAFLRGRKFSEAPDITARICGICPVAYQMSACQAVEDAFEVQIDPAIQELRRLLYCGEWIESHALHIYMLHAPDFLGYEDVIQMAKDHTDAVLRGLRLKKIGNTLMTVLGGREIHPINVRVGGFYRVPEKRELLALADELKWARDASVETAQWAAGFSFPEFERNYEFVALRHPQEYAIQEGRLVSNRGLDIPVAEYEQHFAEDHVQHSNALHSTDLEHGAYFVGPLARYNLNFESLSPLAQATAKEAGLGRNCGNPFQSILVRAVELVYACEEALRIISRYEAPERPFADVIPRVGAGHGCTEAPRGILYHKYRFDEHGLILSAKIVPPTAQNLKTMEEDLTEFVSSRLHLPKDRLQWQCEQAVRNYDPCISCATHSVKVWIERS
ncbi:MAG TPA: Ni/Fe hydrogenase subunit alpha [Candidatus Saccharimonadales bacterium]|nr:Ni/Fe hydrogenase subunit alpha [Candidatus Saccharimonadales bacterium]